MELHGYTHIFFGGPDLALLAKGVLEGWERVAYEQFAYDGAGGEGQSAVYRKMTHKLSEADQQLVQTFGDQKEGWIVPVGWTDDGPWLTWGADGRITVDKKAARELARDRLTYGNDAEHPHSAAAAAVLLVLEAADTKHLDRS